MQSANLAAGEEAKADNNSKASASRPSDASPPYKKATDVWRQLGDEMKCSQSMFPTTFDSALRNIQINHRGFKSTEWKTWTFVVAPILPNDRL